MKKITLLFVCLVLASLLLAAAMPNGTGKSRPLYAADRIVVKLSAQACRQARLPQSAYAETPDFLVNELDQLLSLYGGTKVIRAHINAKDTKWQTATGFDRWFIIKLNGSSSVEAALAGFKANRFVEEAIPEYFAYTMTVPNDPLYPNNWGHNNTAQLPVYQGGGHTGPGVGIVGFDSDAELAWDQEQFYGSEDIIIAIIDTGADTAHPDLRLVPGYDYGDNDNDPFDDSDEQGHGTSCSGIAAGIADNNLGVAGVAGGCSVMPLKIATTDGDIPFSAINNALIHAGDNGVHVASMSFGANIQVGSQPATDAALLYAYDHGVTLFASTANANSSTVYYPAKHQQVIAVGAASPSAERKSYTSSDGENWWGSCYGPDEQDAANAVDVMAPTILPATDITGAGNGYDGSSDYYMWFNGTSCSSPYAAGVAALVKSKDPTLSPAQVRDIITSTATDMTVDGGDGWDRYTGYGMVNANAALAAVITDAPVVHIITPEDGSAIEIGAQVTVEVNAIDPQREITQVEFFLDGSTTPVHTDNTVPYTWTWDTLASGLGTHGIKAVATDNDAKTGQDSVTVIVVLPADEGFESGDFAEYFWRNTGDELWTVQSDETFSGLHTAKSGAIDSDESTELALRLNITESGTLSFFRKVSSASGHGFANFKINGAIMEQWTGEADWEQESYEVTSGVQTFTWQYSKDTSGASGSDCFWLDHIVFPPYTTHYAEPQNLQAPAGFGFVLVHWQVPFAGTPIEYKILRDGTLLDTTQELRYTDSAVVIDHTYLYSVIAVYADGESAPTAAVSAHTLSEPVTEGEIGQGTASTTVQEGCPINLFNRSLHGQSIYTASELNNQGIFGPIDITAIGFYINSAPNLPLSSFVIRMKHTTATTVAQWQTPDQLQTVYTNPAYAPVAGDYDMLTLNTPFTWNGMDNIVIDTAFGQVGTASASGSIRYTNIPDGYHYIRNNSADQTNMFTGGMVTEKRPNVKLSVSVIPYWPLIEVATTSINFGNVLPGVSTVSNFAISNPGYGTLAGEISFPEQFVIQPTGTEGTYYRNTLSYSIIPDSTASFTVWFSPTQPGEYSGNITISHNADGEERIISVTAGSLAAQSLPFVEGYEDGWSEWSTLNGNQANAWILGSDATFSGNNALYISSNEGMTNSYNPNSSSVSYLYRDINIPAGAETYKLRFDWRCKGEGSGPYFDFLRAFIIEPSIVPVPGTILSSGQLGATLNGQDTWQSAAMDIPPTMNGQSKRLVFMWKNDSSQGAQPPAAIDNVRIVAGNVLDYALVTGDSLYTSLPTVVVDETTSISPYISINGFTQIDDYITSETSYDTSDCPYEDTGLDIKLSGANFSGAEIIIYHNLGYKPTFMSYKIGEEGNWMLLAYVPTWNSIKVPITIPANHPDATVLRFSFAAQAPYEIPWLSSFTCSVNDMNKVDVVWSSEEFLDASSFYLWRARENSYSQAVLISDMIPVVENQNDYAYTDSTTVEYFSYYYWLQTINTDGLESFWGPIFAQTGEDPDVPPPPSVSTLVGNFPNPFNPSTKIKYGMKGAGSAKMTIYNSRGQQVAQFSVEHTAAGYYEVPFDGKDHNGNSLSSGLYFCRMQSGGKTSAIKMMLMK